MESDNSPGFAGLTDLAAERYGGLALAANDEFFAEKVNLLKPGRGVFIQDKYTDRGKWMDGWETRRKRGPGHDWCVIQLGMPGVIRGLDIDTNHFLGNHPPFASVDVCRIGAGVAFETAEWQPLLAKSPLQPGSRNLFPVDCAGGSWTHVRLNIFPDGGVARFRVFGLPDPAALSPRADGLSDLAALAGGGRAVACSDMFFSSMQNLIQPGDSLFMGDGWETRRRRGPGHDWLILRLGRPGAIAEAEVFTTHYKGNFPDGFSLEAIHAPGTDIDILNAHTFDWQEILSLQPLGPDGRFAYAREIRGMAPFSHVRVNMYPDGGIARLRLWGHPA